MSVGSVKKFSVAVFGCTGNAGRATALFAIKFANGRKVALAGRNESKVRALKDSVCEELGHSANNVGIIIADAKDAKSMLAMASAAAVVIACAGPFQRYGEAAVEACIKGGAHYVDITGETPWVNQMTNKYGEAAKKANVSLLSFAGYDCMPAELAMYLSGEALENHGGGMASLDMVFVNRGGGFPKGTLNTVMDGLDGKWSIKRSKGDTPVVPPKFKTAQKSAVSPQRWLLPQWSHTQEWTVQNFMAGINTVALSRSATDLGYEPFSMNDRLAALSFVPGSGYVRSILTLWGLLPCIGYQLTTVMGALLLIPTIRSWFKGWLQTYTYSGLARGRIACDARAVSKDGQSKVDVHIGCRGDAGIYCTGLFAATVAWTLVDVYSSPGRHKEKVLTGFHSPVAALHGCPQLFTNLKTAGVDMQVTRTIKGGSKERVAISKL